MGRVVSKMETEKECTEHQPVCCGRVTSNWRRCWGMYYKLCVPIIFEEFYNLVEFFVLSTIDEGQ